VVCKEAAVHGKILLIDDDPLEAAAVRVALAGPGNVSFQVAWVRHCSEGLGHLAAQKELPQADRKRGIAAILLNLYLRDSHGIETFNQVFRAARPIPILVLTAAHDEHVARAAVQLGAQNYLLKSVFTNCFSPQALRSMVARSSPTGF
jgi:DNA-binding NarL/FixJ family response regulator